MVDKALEGVLTADVLVIGGGIAGLFAAIKAKEKEPSLRVVLVDKGYPGRSGCSVFANGIFPHWMPGDKNLEEYIKEIVVENAEYLVDQDYVRVAVRESYDRFQDLLKFGVEFARDSEGKLKRIPTMTARYGFCTPFAGGPHLMWKVRAAAERLGITCMERIMITDLLMREERCQGAVGFHVRDGGFFIFKSKATVLAAGTFYSYLAPMGASGATGDGVALAFRAGLKLRNMEQMKTGYGCKNLPGTGLHVIFGEGGILVNACGERFMERFSPQLKEEAPRYVGSRAIVQEWKEGRGPCYVDCTHLPASAIDTIKRSLPLFMRSLEARGLDIARDRIEYVPYSLGLLDVGGTMIENASGRVPVQGLWVAGAAGDYCGGVEATAAGALSGSSVQGARAGIEAAKYAKRAGIPKLSKETIHGFREEAFAPSRRKRERKIEPEKIIDRILKTAFRYINVLRNEAPLKIAIQELEAIGGMMAEVKVKDSHDLQKFHNARNMLQVAQTSAMAGLHRTESRRAHYRIDYPKRDDENWLKWIIARQENGKVILRTKDIPLGKWKYRP